MRIIKQNNESKRSYKKKKKKTRFDINKQMPCYICVEEEGELMNIRGCHCKGGIEIHQACLQEWIIKADNPFNCTVCKCDYSATFLKKFLTDEEILYHPKGTEDEEDYGDYDDQEFVQHFYNGISFMTTGDMLLFESKKDETTYFEMINKEDYAVKKDLRRLRKNTMRFKVKMHRLPKRNKTIPFRK